MEKQKEPRIRLNHKCVGCYEDIYLGTLTTWKGKFYHTSCLLEAERKEQLKEVLKLIDEWEKENKEVLKTEDIIKKKITIADYIKWDRIKELKQKLEGKNEVTRS